MLEVLNGLKDLLRAGLQWEKISPTVNPLNFYFHKSGPQTSGRTAFSPQPEGII